MKPDNDEYLKRILNSKKIELESLHINHRICIAEFEAKKEMLNKDIDSLESQLAP